MTQASRQFKVVLAQDVRYVYAKGLDETIEATVIPALANLAEGLNGTSGKPDERYYGDIVEATLHRVIGGVSRGKRREGLSTLFGLGVVRVEGQIGLRRDQAAPLLGFTSGDSLRQSEREGRKVVDIFLEEIVDQLMVLADEAGLSFANWSASTPDHSETQAPLDGADAPSGIRVTRDDPYRAARFATSVSNVSTELSITIFRELERLSISGFSTATEDCLMPTLVKLAHVVRGDDHLASFIVPEELLASAIRGTVTDQPRHEEVMALFGLGRFRGRSLEDRRTLGAPNLAKDARSIIWTITNHLVVLALTKQVLV